jgi:hypothetical protein
MEYKYISYMEKNQYVSTTDLCISSRKHVEADDVCCAKCKVKCIYDLYFFSYKTKCFFFNRQQWCGADMPYLDN